MLFELGEDVLVAGRRHVLIERVRAVVVRRQVQREVRGWTIRESEAAAVDVGAVAAVFEVTVGVDEESLAIVAADVQVGAPAERRAYDRSAAGRTVIKRAGRDKQRRAIVPVTLQRAERV